MIGRAAMSAPWIFRQTKQYLANGQIMDAPDLTEKWDLILPPLPVGGGGMEHGRTSHPLIARASDGVLEKLSRQQDAP
jgi:hypothetical protein